MRLEQRMLAKAIWGLPVITLLAIYAAGCPQRQASSADGYSQTAGAAAADSQTGQASAAAAREASQRGMSGSILFMHHSCGSNLISQGKMREAVTAFNAAHGTKLEFWDHGYNSQGLLDAQGKPAGSYDIPGDNTNPDGLHALWTSQDAICARSRELILASHDVIAFKSCYPASNIANDLQLRQYQLYYLEMRDFFDTRPDKTFVVVSPPPLHRLATDPATARRARAFSSWLAGGEYLDGHPNVFQFNLFDQLAEGDHPSDTANMLRYDYEKDHASKDSHPNELANRIAGPLFAEFLCEAALAPRAD